MTCDIIKDLIPMYVDDTASVETKNLVEQHMETCPECKGYCRAIKKTEARICEPLYGKEKAREIVREKSGDITELDRQFATLSQKLKKRKIRNAVLGIALLAGLTAYVTVDIINAVKRKENVK